MTDTVEINSEQSNTQIESPDVNTDIIDSYEAEARDQGWKPLDEYEGDKSKWRTSKEFVERGELFKKIDPMGKELKATRRALQMLKEHHTKVKETEYAKAVVFIFLKNKDKLN